MTTIYGIKTKAELVAISNALIGIGLELKEVNDSNEMIIFNKGTIECLQQLEIKFPETIVNFQLK